MAAIGIALLWGSYAIGLYGYSLIRGYDNTFGGLLNPLHIGHWSTNLYTGSNIIPGRPAPGTAGQGGGPPGKPQCPPGHVVGPSGRCEPVNTPGAGK